MSRRPFASLVLLLFVACGSTTVGSGVDSGVRGVVVTGPQCPVESASSPCPDKPWTGTVEATNGSDRVDQRTDPSGRFEIRLAPGTWTLAPLLEGGGPPSARPVTVTVRPHVFASATLVVDTGIR